ncbi:novel interactor of JAZ [Striga asiatica]|uniref:Novel interactor of JAZ n=1 Tax=Striga asiatica TaxID=4170 RepID=A0A5A7RE08_STRAF|nr:novel interactor of JAZ [Striga asiatica]
MRGGSGCAGTGGGGCATILRWPEGGRERMDVAEGGGDVVVELLGSVSRPPPPSLLPILSLSPSPFASTVPSFSSTVPSFSPASHLVVTSGQPEQISINIVSDTPIFDDGFVFVYAIDGFFHLKFTLAVADPANPNPRSDSHCLN